MVLTEEVQKDIYPIASLENTEAVNLEKAFYNIDGVNIVDKSAAMQIPDYANNNGIPSNNSQVTETNMSQRLYRLNGNVQGSKMGLGITLKVMAGDQVDILAKSYWKTADGNVTGTPSAIDLEGLLTNFVGNGIANKQGITGPLLNSAGGITSMLNELLNGQSQTSTRPKAYLNWILFDENFRPVTGSGHTNSGFDAVGANGELKPHSKSTGEITKNGYLYIYCSNESRLDVFFDNLQVIHTRGALLEETHYYPFGLTMAGISSKGAGSLENIYKFNDGTELNSNWGLSWYETEFRIYDPQIGRFLQIDAMSEFLDDLTPYNFANNNPILLNDPLGLLSDSANPQILPTVVVVARVTKLYKDILPYITHLPTSAREEIKAGTDAFSKLVPKPNPLGSTRIPPYLSPFEIEEAKRANEIILEGASWIFPWGKVLKIPKAVRLARGFFRMKKAVKAGFIIEGQLAVIWKDSRLFKNWIRAKQSLSRVSNPLSATEAQQLIDNARALGIKIEHNLKGLKGLEVTGEWGGIPHFKIGSIHIPIQGGLENILKF